MISSREVLFVRSKELKNMLWVAGGWIIITADLTAGFDCRASVGFSAMCFDKASVALVLFKARRVNCHRVSFGGFVD